MCVYMCVCVCVCVCVCIAALVFMMISPMLLLRFYFLLMQILGSFNFIHIGFSHLPFTESFGYFVDVYHEEREIFEREAG